MAVEQTKHMGSLQAKDVSIRTQTIIWPTSTFVTTWTLGGDSDPTETPATVAPAPDSTSNGGQNVGPILSGIVAFLVLVLVVWLCCRRSSFKGRNSRRSSRQRGSGPPSKGSSSESATSNNSSRRGRSVGSAASEIIDGNQWNQQGPVPVEHLPEMPPQAAGRWPVPAPQPNPGMGQMPPPGMGFPLGRGGPPPMMGRGAHPGAMR
ncbi:uncharacterized protein F4822DRAFT_432917 [Hypoxylon trugodes]|uniref:uncharacterized protein n=1 Tax=Hypoxylon trugodes TaxID=326681 RepID=UPI00219BFE4B|nr:uncharacterized protein F4822DRAFT_432917 [Hypoxylon trugodes]KAI1384369.1 hypothetical protein F4822DRAFT_432917 [Hypoxylon trugodes]